MAETANVDIVIDAVTEAAKDAVDSVGNELGDLAKSARPASSAVDQVADDLDDATSSAVANQSSISEVASEALQAAGANNRLASAADEAGDNLLSAAGASSLASGAYSRLSFSAGGATLSTTALGAAVTSTLIPALLTLSTILFPLAATLGAVASGALALAGAFGVLVGTGVATHMQELKKAFKDIRGPVMAAIEPLGQVLGPLLVEAVRALPALVQNIVDAIGPLGQFRDTLVRLGQSAFDVIPRIVSAMFDLAQVALPIFEDLVSFIGSEGPGAFQGMMEVARETGPLFLDLAMAIGRVLPELTEIGTIVASMVLPTLTTLFGLLDTGLSAFLGLGDALAELGVAAALTAPVVFKVAGAIGALLGPVGLAAAAVTAFAAAYKSNFMDVREITNDAIAAVVSVLTDLAARAMPMVNDAIDLTVAAFERIQGVLADLVARARPIVDRVIGALVGAFETVASSADDTFGTLQQVVDDVLGFYQTHLGGTISATQDLVDTIVPLFFQMVDGLQAFGRIIKFVILNWTIPLFQRLLSVAQKNLGPLVDEFIETYAAILDVVDPILSTIISLYDGALETLLMATRFFEGIVTAIWTRFGDEIVTAVKFAFDAMIGIIGTALDALFTVIMVALNLIQGDFGEAFDVIADFAMDTFQGIVDFVKKWGIVSAIRSAVSGAVEAVRQFIMVDLPGYFLIGLSTVLGVIDSIGASIYNVWASLFNSLLQITTTAVQKLVNSTIGAMNALLATIEGVADAVSEIPGIDAPDIGRLKKTKLDSQALQVDRRNANATRAAKQNAQTMAAVLNLKVDGDGPLAKWLEEQASVKQEKQSAQQDRYQRRQNLGGGSETGG